MTYCPRLSCQCFATGQLELALDLARLRDHPHASAAPAVRSLDDHWEADLVGERLRRSCVAHRAVCALYDGHAALNRLRVYEGRKFILPQAKRCILDTFRKDAP
jgi:hypothetical protein